MRTQSPDTNAEAEKVMMQLLRNASAARKFHMIEENCQLVRQATWAGLKSRYPEEGSEKLKRRLADLWLGRELAEVAFGPLEP